MKLLHIIATPRENKSRTLKVSNSFLEALKIKHTDLEIDELNLFTDPPPPLTVKQLDGKYILLGGKDLPAELKDEWANIIKTIGRFLSANLYVVSTPMWNFSIPYALKHYIDIILQPKFLFQYTDKGPEGLAKNKKMLVVTSRGGDYSEGSPFQSYDFQEPYLRAVFGFAGITDISFINAQPMDAGGPDLGKSKLEEAISKAKEVAETF
jgi:FMN-dependent NADH-azoreductase